MTIAAVIATRAAIGALTIAVTVVACMTHGGAREASPTYGDCEVSGRYGQFKIAPTSRGVLTVDASLPAPGWWNGKSPGLIRDGYEYCMAANIAYRAGLDRVKVKNEPIAEIVTGKTKDFDLALSEITITRQREKVVDFSPPYLSASQGVLTKRGTAIDSRTMHHIRIGVLAGTTGEKFVESRLKPAGPVTAFHSAPDMISALAHGHVDAIVHDTTILLAYAQKSGGTLTVVGQYRTGEHYGALYPKGSPNEASMDRIIRQMIEDGTLAKFSAIYLGQAYGRDPAGIPYFPIRPASG
ncbi:ABC transporter substrate-binding protein [Streptomyces sp. NPDC048419]|uniref:ABC transporter substrate-binding protein n=1 Tax=Streptomyces sp. NPDC048419 TaxID=3365547 RepID=UPI00371FB9C5